MIHAVQGASAMPPSLSSSRADRRRHQSQSHQSILERTVRVAKAASWPVPQARRREGDSERRRARRTT